MSDYQQPEFYRFNSDSLRLVEFVSEKISTAWSVLDAGAGCGVIGLELSKKLKPQHLSLLELQKEFLPSLEENVQQQCPDQTKAEIIHSSFGTWVPSRPYDLVVSNPPYFLPGHGERSADPLRQLARSFKHEGWRCLLELTAKSLAPNGRGFMVVKNNKVLLHEVHRYFPVNLKRIEHVAGDLIFLELMRLNEN